MNDLKQEKGVAKMKKRIIFLSILAGAVFLLLTGCNFVDLTEDESRQIVNYSTNVLNDHNSAVKGSLKDLTRTDLRDIVVKDDPTIIDEIAEIKEQAALEEASGSKTPAPAPSGSGNAEGGTEEPSDTGDGDGELTPVDAEISDMIGLEGFDVEYGGHDFLDSYPGDNAEEALFSIEPATDNDQLLVLYFYITNPSEEAKECDILSLDNRFKYKSSGKTSSFMTTLLLDDLSTYVSEIEPGGRNRAVLISEISREKAESLSDLTLIINKGEESLEVPLET